MQGALGRGRGAASKAASKDGCRKEALSVWLLLLLFFMYVYMLIGNTNRKYQ